MAEEHLIESLDASTVVSVAADYHKRKHLELELNSVPELPTEFDTNPDVESVGNGPKREENGGEEESECKRARIETNGGNVDDAGDGIESGRSAQEEETRNELSEVPVQQHEPAGENGQESAGSVPPQVPVVDGNEIEKNEVERAVELGRPKDEVEEKSEEVHGFPVTPTENQLENQPIVDAEIVSHKIEVPNDRVGVLIGKAGDTIRSLQDNSGAKIQILRDADADLRSVTRPVELVGTWESINKAEKLIKDVIAEADAGGSPSLVARGFSAVQVSSGGEQIEMPVPIDKVGLVIGKGGETIRNLQTRSGARIQLLQQSPSDGSHPNEKRVRVTGTRKQIEIAKEMIEDVMNQNFRPSPLSGVYNQSGYRPHGPNAPYWGPRGPPHSQYPGFDFPQRGPYPSQYPPQSYGNYPPPQAPRGGFGPGWDHRPRSHPPFYQGNYNYGHQQGPDYGAPPSYPPTAPQPYGHGYGDSKYDYHAPTQAYGSMGSHPATYPQSGGAPTGYHHPDQYSRPPMYNMQPQGPPQSYSQPRPGQPGEVPPYSGPGSSSQPYAHAMPSQQPYPYTSGAMQQTYPPYSSMPSDGYGNVSSTAPSSGYPQGGYGAAPIPQQATTYPQPTASGMYGSYSAAAQSGYGDHQAATNAYSGYQPATAQAAYTGTQAPSSYPSAAQAATAPTYTGTQVASASYPSTAATGPVSAQSGYTQTAQPQLTYDQSGGYGSIAASSTATKTSDSTAYPQYDSSQMYGASR